MIPASSCVEARPAPSRRRRAPTLRSDTAISALVGIALFAVYVAVTRGRIKSYDGTIMVNLATRLLTQHTLTIDPKIDSLNLQHPYTSYGFGTSLVALPFVALQRAINPRSQAVLSLASPVLLATSGSLLYLIGRQLTWRRAVCVLTALGFGLLTPALWQSTEMLSETGVTVATLFVVLGVLRWRSSPRSSSVLVGVGAAAAVLYRPDSLVLVVPFAAVVFFLVPRDAVLTREPWWEQVRQWRRSRHFNFGTTTIGTGPCSAPASVNRRVVRASTRLCFGDSTCSCGHRAGGSSGPRSSCCSRCPASCCSSAGAAPSRSVSAYSSSRWFLFYARWFTPGGGVAWGPRLLFPVTALLAIVAGEAVESIWRLGSIARRRAAWAAVTVLALASAAISFLSVAIGYEVYWNRWTRVAPNVVASRRNSYYWSLRHNVIVGNYHLLRSGAPIAPMHFRDGADAVGVVALVVGCLSVGAALFAARERTSSASSVENDRFAIGLTDSVRADGVVTRGHRRRRAR